MTLVVAGVLLMIFRAEVRKLVDWLVRFRRVAKTREGYSLEGASEPEKERLPPADAARQLVESAEAVPPPGVAETTDTWYKAVADKRYDDAVSLLEAEANRTTDLETKVSTMSVIGHVKFKQNPTTGVAYFENLIREHPTRYQPYQWWALTYDWKNLPERCLAIIERGLGVVQNKTKLLNTKSDCLLDMGRVDDAIAAALQGVEADPTYSANYVTLARGYSKNEKKEASRSSYLRALDVSEGSEDVLVEYAEFLANNGYTAEAILRYRDLVDRQPNNPHYRALAGNVYLTADLNSLALSAYQAASKLAEDKQGWILANIGNLFKNRGFYAEAIRYLKKALELDAGSQYAHERLAQAQQLQAAEGKKLESLLAEARQTLSKREVPSEPPAA
jgi:tetratricopeptide (TPR) repeat protein